MPDSKRQRNKNQSSKDTRPSGSNGPVSSKGPTSQNSSADSPAGPAGSAGPAARHSSKAALHQEGESDEAFRSCTRKKRYASRVEASKAAASNARRKDVPQLFVYECELCGGWHLTHRKPGR